MRNLVFVVTVLALAAGCGSKNESASKSADSGKPTVASANAGGKSDKKSDKKADAPKSSGIDWSTIDKLVEGAKADKDFDAILEKCLSAGIDLAMQKKVEDLDKDPDYWKHCKIGPARARAKIVIAESTPDKMHPLCIAAGVQADEIAESTKPEAEEFKKLAADINKACGL